MVWRIEGSRSIGEVPSSASRNCSASPSRAETGLGKASVEATARLLIVQPRYGQVRSCDEARADAASASAARHWARYLRRARRGPALATARTGAQGAGAMTG